MMNKTSLSDLAVQYQTEGYWTHEMQDVQDEYIRSEEIEWIRLWNEMSPNIKRDDFYNEYDNFKGLNIGLWQSSVGFYRRWVL